ncbi:MAG TPA: choice-of-anchor Q domain-containing protein [Solirubrobacterales bacterium]|jgi:CSLREA domain-containing protein
MTRLIRPPLRRSHLLTGLLAGCLAGLVLLTTASAATAKTYFPTRTDDPAPNGCTKKDCSLREAVIAANASGGGKIVLRPGKRYELTRQGAGENDALTGDLDLKAPTAVTTKGKRGDPATIDANGIDRIFEGSPVLDRVILRDGHARVTPGDNGNGGAVLGRAQVIDSRFIHNTADGRGGAIYIDSGQGQIRKSRFKGNRAASDGGAIYLASPCMGLPPGALTFWGSRAAHNSAGGNGGAIFSYCLAWLSNSYLGDNSARGAGGGLFSPGSAIPPEAVTHDPTQWSSRVVMFGTTVTGNDARSFGGGIALDAGALSSEISSSTISGNSTAASGGGVGINAPAAKPTVSLAMENSTLANNQAGRDAGGIGTADAAVGFGSHATVSLNHATIARNQANTALESGAQRAGLGGGIYEEDRDSFSVHNTLVALNTVATFHAPQPSDCATGFGNPFQSLGHNLIGNPVGCQGFGAAGDLFGGKLKLGKLAKNGGPTKTIALGKGSRAINRADTPGTVSDTYDQRDYSRYKRPDIGSYEWRGKPRAKKK